MNARDDQYSDLLDGANDTAMLPFLTLVARVHDIDLSMETQERIARQLNELSADELVPVRTNSIPRTSIRRRLAVAAAACVVATAGGLSVAAASSASVRHALVQVIPPLGLPGISMSGDGRPVKIRPNPSIEVYYPRSLPADLQIVGTGQLPDSGLTVGLNCGDTDTICRHADTRLLDLFPPPPTGPFDWPATIAPFTQQKIPVVWIGRHGIPPDGRSIQIVEWSADARRISGHPNATIAGEPAIVDHRGEDTVVSLKRGATAIQITTNLGAASAETIAASMATQKSAHP